uniref:Uncharacterized protein n=1 Tax=Arundo donax TaxID=35708 RepID=A0A0A9A594_ARUDO
MWQAGGVVTDPPGCEARLRSDGRWGKGRGAKKLQGATPSVV